MERDALKNFFEVSEPIVRLVCNIEPAGGGKEGEGGGGGSGGAPAIDEKTLDDRINRAITGRLDRFAKEKIEPVLSGIDAIRKKLEGEGGEGGEGSKKKDAPAGDEATKREKEREARLAAIEKERAAEKAERERERAEMAAREERGEIEKLLRAKGVPDERLRGAVAVLHSEDKRVRRSKEDAKRVVFVVPREGFEEEVSLETGIAAWLETSEGKSYLPPTGASGSGAGGAGKRPPTSDKKLSKQEKLAEAKKQLVRGFGFRA